MSMHWKLKAWAFRILSTIPLGAWLHYQLQRHVTKEWPRRTGHLDELLVAARRIAAAVRHQGSELAGAQFLEVGAGRDLAVAVALRLLGVQRVTCVDISRLAKLPLIDHAARHLAHRIGVAVPRLATWEDLEAFGISYRAPADLRAAGVALATVDCFYSVDTLEHIPRVALVDVLRRAHPLLRVTGLCVHLIDYGDHYARGEGLSRFNFLTFSQSSWAPYNSSLQYVNRMRHSEYLQVFADAGFAIVAAEPDREPPESGVLARLAPEFRTFVVEDLFTIRAMVVARPA